MKDIPKSTILVFAGVFLFSLLTSCQENTKSAQLTQNSDSEDCVVTEDEAKEIADNWLEAKGLDWGASKSIEYFDAIQEYHRQEFHVNYGSAEPETILDSKQTVIINCMTGEVREGLAD